MTNIASLTFLSNIREARAVKNRLTKLTFPSPAVSDLAMSSIWEISNKPKKTIKLLRYFTKSALDVSPLFQCSKMTRVGGSKLNRIITHEISVGNLDKLLRTLPDSFFRSPPSLSSLKPTWLTPYLADFCHFSPLLAFFSLSTATAFRFVFFYSSGCEKRAFETCPTLFSNKFHLKLSKIVNSKYISRSVNLNLR